MKIKPYYKTKLGKLYCGDCLEIMPQLEPVDLVLTDPPYGINHGCNFKSRGRGNLAKCNDYENVYGDNKPFDPKSIIDMNIPTVLFGSNYFCDKLPISSGWLVWDKLRPDNLDQATCELAWTNFVKGVRRFKYLWHGCMKKGEQGQNYHPTQKPVALMMWILNLKWTPVGIVLDPYCGAGSTLIACEKLNRKWIGIELSEEYCEITKQRIKYRGRYTEPQEIKSGFKLL